MEYPETLTAATLLDHVDHVLSVERYSRHPNPVAVAIDCQTCGIGIALEWIESVPA